MRKILVAVALFSATILAGCDAGPGCWVRTFRNGQSIVECR